MYDTAKKAREAMKSKARRLATEKTEKVSSSDWTPPEPLNADVKTGARPISRRAFKSGGKVDGSCGAMRADRKPRKAGGKAESEKAEAKQYAIAKVNRNVKEANEQREGIKHVGGFKKGGRAEKADGGSSDKDKQPIRHDVVDRQSGKVVGSFKTLARAMNFRDKKDNEYGGSRYTRKPIYEDSDSSGDGKKHGGRAEKETGGGLFMNGRRIPSATAGKPIVDKTEQRASTPAEIKRAESHMSQMGKSVSTDKGMSADEARKFLEGRKSGGRADASVKQAKTFAQKAKGRANKMMGGPMMDPRMSMVKDRALDFGGQGITPGVSAMKKGGKVHADEAMDKALIKKMVKPEARAKRADGGRGKQIKMSEGEQEYGKGETPLARAIGEINRKFTPEYFKNLKKERQERLDRDPEYQEFKARREKREADKSMDDAGYKKGGKVHSDEAMDKALIKKMVKPEARKGKAIGGILTKSGMGGLLPMAMEAMRGDKDEKAAGGRTARKDGGKVKSKGKTNIAIVINAGQKPQQPGPGMAPMDAAGPDGMPIPVPPPAPAGGAPMPMPMPMPMPAAAPPMHGAAPAMGGMPMPRKAGGRVTKVASSYKDMEAGAGSGEGRLQKTDIAKKLPKPGLTRGVIVDDNKGYPNKVNGATGGRTARATGGKAYRSYKDMDAGAGSGKGRLEKTEIEAHKR